MKCAILIGLLLPLIGFSEEPVNPTTMDWYVEAYNRVSLEYAGRRSSDWHLFVEGTECDEYQLSTSSLQADSSSMVMGSISYGRGTRREVSWCDVYDVDYLRPYLVADSSTGDYHHEKYELSGGYVLKSGPLRYGISARYRGVTAYRKSDPRPQNTISQIIVSPGLAFSDARRDYGYSLHYQYYRQYVKSLSYEPTRKDFFFLMKGLGQYDYLFSESSGNMRRYYILQEYGAKGEIRQNNHTLQAWYMVRRMSVEENDYRKPYHMFSHQYAINYLYNPKASTEGGWQVDVEAQMQKHDGRERIFYIEDRDVHLIAEQGKYCRKLKWADFSSSYFYMGARTNWSGSAYFQYADQNEHYFPGAQQKWEHITMGCEGSARRKFTQTAIQMDMGVSYRKICNSELKITDPIETMEWVKNEYDFQNQDFFQIQGNFVYSILIKQNELNLNGRIIYLQTSNNKWNRHINVGIYYQF